LPGNTFNNPGLGNAKLAMLVGRGILVAHVSLLRPVRGRNCGWPERTDANVGHYLSPGNGRRPRAKSSEVIGLRSKHANKEDRIWLMRLCGLGLRKSVLMVLQQTGLPVGSIGADGDGGLASGVGLHHTSRVLRVWEGVGTLPPDITPKRNLIKSEVGYL